MSHPQMLIETEIPPFELVVPPLNTRIQMRCAMECIRKAFQGADQAINSNSVLRGARRV